MYEYGIFQCRGRQENGSTGGAVRGWEEISPREPKAWVRCAGYTVSETPLEADWLVVCPSSSAVLGELLELLLQAAVGLLRRRQVAGLQSLPKLAHHLADRVGAAASTTAAVMMMAAWVD